MTMDFVSFARAHGVIIDHLPPIGVWARLNTEDKPKHRNGAVKYMGSHGFVQNHATMTEVAVWRGEMSQVARQQARQITEQAHRETQQAQRRAAEKAAWILGQCSLETHAYFSAKGFHDELVNVWERGESKIAALPMRIGRELVGVQLISESGQKKFLAGQRTGRAEFVFGDGGIDVLCEGYATGLSVRHALKNMKVRHTLHVCFSAGNMAKIAEGLRCGIVIADNDESRTGERTAQAIGWPYWMSDTVGEDGNDYAQRRGLFALGCGLKSIINKKLDRQEQSER